MMLMMLAEQRREYTVTLY